MGKPKKIDVQSRRLPAIRCTEKEDRSIREKAEKSGLSLSEYVRKSALSKRIIVRENTVDLMFIFQLKRLASNLNQQTKRYHLTGDPPGELKELWGKVNEVLNFVMEKAHGTKGE